MSAEVYFREMMNVPGVSPVIEGDTIYWQAERYPAPDGLFPDALGWDYSQYYSTIQAADIDGDGQTVGGIRTQKNLLEVINGNKKRS
jgi:hypothetical protein